MMTTADTLSAYKGRAQAALGAVKVSEVAALVHYLEAVREDGAAVYVVGNGGSQATAAHLVLHLRNTGVRAFDLLGDNAWLTAISNDCSYREAPAWLAGTLRRAGDALFVISGSGKSENVLCALEGFDGVRLGLLGFGGGEARMLCNASVVLPEEEYGPVEDAHLAVVHMLAEGLK
jgi:D-sedoheptulose 7-phosphate isomerase